MAQRREGVATAAYIGHSPEAEETWINEGYTDHIYLAGDAELNALGDRRDRLEAGLDAGPEHLQGRETKRGRPLAEPIRKRNEPAHGRPYIRLHVRRLGEPNRETGGGASNRAAGGGESNREAGNGRQNEDDPS